VGADLELRGRVGGSEIEGWSLIEVKLSLGMTLGERDAGRLMRQIEMEQNALHGGGECLDAGSCMKPLLGKRPPRSVANEPLEIRSVVALDADRCVDGPPRLLPRMQVRRRSGTVEYVLSRTAHHRSGNSVPRFMMST